MMRLRGFFLFSIFLHAGLFLRLSDQSPNTPFFTGSTSLALHVNSSPQRTKIPFNQTQGIRFSEKTTPLHSAHQSTSLEPPSSIQLIRSRILAALKFPDEIRKKRIQGSVDLLLALSADGSLEWVQIAKSSGSLELDRLAQSAVIQAQPYPVQSKLTLAVPIRFQLL